MASITFRFGDYELDSGALELRHAGRVVAIEPTPLRVLLHLVQERRRVVRKNDLRKAVWRDVIVGDAALAGALRDVRRALGDDGVAQRWIRTRQRVGYQFVGKVEINDVTPLSLEPAPRRQRLYGTARGLSSAFTGRARELAELEVVLLRETYWSPQVSIEGLAGIGKTELALQVVHKLAHRGAFPGGVFWLDAGETDLRRIWGTTIADQLAVPFTSPEERSARVLDELERGSGEATLLVLDNVESWATHLRPGPLPQSPHVRVLVTTRQRNLGGARFVHLSLSPLPAPHDRELLERVALRPLGSEADALLAQLAGHPLALELAGAFLGTYASESAPAYLAALAQDSEASEALVKDRVGYEGTVAQAFRAVCKRLSEPAREAWWLTSFFEPEPVTREIAHACGIGRDSLRALEENHLIQFGVDGSFTMHQLTREFGARLTPAPARALALLEAMGENLLLRSSLAAELRRVYEAAGRLLHVDGTSANRIVVALEAQWHMRYFSADARSAITLADALAELARSSRSDLHLLTACTASSATAFIAGQPAASMEWAQRGLALCDELEADEPGALFDRRAFLLMQSALAKLWLGFPDTALREIDAAVERLLKIDSPGLLTYAMVTQALVHYWRREWEDVVRTTNRLALVDTADAMVIEILRSILAAGTRVTSGARPAEPLLEIVRVGLRRCRELQLGERMSHVAADALLCLGQRAEALESIQEGLLLHEHTGERFLEAELWRLRAAVETGVAERRRYLDQALQVAASQGSRWLALRIATELVELAEQALERAQARARLQHIYDGFSEGFELWDLRRARGALECSSWPPAPSPAQGSNSNSGG